MMGYCPGAHEPTSVWLPRALHVSGDGGRSWAPIDPVPELPVGAEKCYGPEVAFDRNGVLHYLFVGRQDMARPSIVVVRHCAGWVWSGWRLGSRRVRPRPRRARRVKRHRRRRPWSP